MFIFVFISSCCQNIIITFLKGGLLSWERGRGYIKNCLLFNIVNKVGDQGFLLSLLMWFCICFKQLRGPFNQNH